MTSDTTDRDLHAQFGALRERDLTAAPEFEVVLARAAVRARPPPARRLSRPTWAAGLAVAVVAVAIWVVPRQRPASPDDGALALPGWRTPTDSLLADAGDPLQRSSWAALPTAGLGQPSFNRSEEIRR